VEQVEQETLELQELPELVPLQAEQEIQVLQELVLPQEHLVRRAIPEQQELPETIQVLSDHLLA